MSSDICGVVFGDRALCTLHKGHHACGVGMHFGTERAPPWWERRWSRLPGLGTLDRDWIERFDGERQAITGVWWLASIRFEGGTSADERRATLP